MEDVTAPTVVDTVVTPEVDVTELQAEIERLRKHNDTLLGEKKSTSQKAKDAEAEAKRLSEEKAKRDGDYETLLQTRESEIAQTTEELTQLRNTVANKEKSLYSNDIVNGLDPVDQYAGEVINRFVADRLVYKDNQVLITDANGNESAMTKADLISELRKDPRFKHLVAGSGATGGGATGGVSGNSVTPNLNATAAKNKGDLASYLKHTLSGVI